ncbi:MAG: hypothetical protein JW384_00683 [Nitrosomonadaceae bacterium]|nr:hypothetical protein [Nitrosomonadaceae bacterium]
MPDPTTTPISDNWNSLRIRINGLHDKQLASFFLDILLISTIMILIGAILVPAHWTSIWMDREFTGWVAPIANKMAHGQRLYEDGGHLPLPPLPFLLMRALFQGEATWLSESVLNFLFQSALVLTMYVGGLIYFGRQQSLVATLITAEFVFSLPKSILYDSMVQFFIAAAATINAAFMTTLIHDNGFLRKHSRLFIAAPVLIGVALGLALLSKHSSALFCTFGILTANFLYLGRHRIKTSLQISILMALGMLAILALVYVFNFPYFSASGMLYDVFVYGSEVKGGWRLLTYNLWLYTQSILKSAIAYALFLIPLFLFSIRQFVTHTARTSHDSLFLNFSLCILIISLLWFSDKFGLYPQLTRYGQDAMEIGLLVALLLVALTVVWRTRLIQSGERAVYLVMLVYPTFVAAVGHNLSVATFRWRYDNNPLIYAVALLIVYIIHSYVTEFLPKMGTKVFVVVSSLLIVMMSMPLRLQAGVALTATESWDDVPYLSGARLRKSADGMHALLLAVRSLPLNRGDTVLLLPSDPNVEAWFERDSPKLSSLIVFTDQYLDRYVDVDFERLAANPPRIIILGPRNYWRNFTRVWHLNWGAERLIDRVANELLPLRYELYAAQEINHRGATDYMDVYQRR